MRNKKDPSVSLKIDERQLSLIYWVKSNNFLEEKAEYYLCNLWRRKQSTIYVICGGESRVLTM